MVVEQLAERRDDQTIVEDEPGLEHVDEELRAGHFAVGLAPGGELEDKHQQAVEQENGQLVPALPEVSRVGNSCQLAEQGRQLLAQEARLLADGVLAGIFLFGDGREG